MLVIDDQLESTPWITETGLNVNPIPADAFLPAVLPGGALKVTNASSKTFGGALVAAKRPVPSIPGVTLSYVGLDLQVKVSSDDMPLLGRLEIDVKVCVKSATGPPIANIANFSSQLNLSNGQWQISGAQGQWLDTGFTPTLAASTWTPLGFRYLIGAGWFSMLSANWQGTRFEVPAALQRVPFEVSNWQMVAAVQLQTEVIVPGGLSVLYDHIRLSWSDQPF